MSELSDNEVRSFLLGFFEEQLALRGYAEEEISDDFDLLTMGVIDSLGFLEMTVALQEEFDVELDFDEIDPEEMSIVGPLCQYITSKKKGRPVIVHDESASYYSGIPVV